MYLWKDAAIDAYEAVDPDAGYKECPICHVLPRIWVFDNGCFARCRCFYKYEEAPVRVESINSYAKRHNGSINGYNHSQDLIDAWNKFVENREFIRVDQIGRW